MSKNRNAVLIAGFARDYEKYIDIRYHKDYRRSMSYEKDGERYLRWA